MKPFKHLWRGRVKWGKNGKKKKPSRVARIWRKRLLNYRLLTSSHLEYFHRFYAIKSRYLVSPLYIFQPWCLFTGKIFDNLNTREIFTLKKVMRIRESSTSSGFFTPTFLLLSLEIFFPFYPRLPFSVPFLSPQLISFRFLVHLYGGIVSSQKSILIH